MDGICPERGRRWSRIVGENMISCVEVLTIIVYNTV